MNSLLMTRSVIKEFIIRAFYHIAAGLDSRGENEYQEFRWNLPFFGQ